MKKLQTAAITFPVEPCRGMSWIISRWYSNPRVECFSPRSPKIGGDQAIDPNGPVPVEPRPRLFRGGRVGGVNPPEPHAIRPTGKTPIQQRAMLGLLQGDHHVGPREVFGFA